MLYTVIILYFLYPGTVYYILILLLYKIYYCRSKALHDEVHVDVKQVKQDHLNRQQSNPQKIPRQIDGSVSCDEVLCFQSTSSC